MMRIEEQIKLLSTNPLAADYFLLDGEQYYDSDNELWFGNKLEGSWKECKTMNRENRNLPKSANRLSQKLDSNDEDGTVKVKPNALPTLFQIEAKIFKQDMSPVDYDVNVVRGQKVNLFSETDAIDNHEPCPLTDSDITSVHFTSTGGVMVIEEYAITVVIPNGAIEDHHMVEIQAAASLFGPFDIPNDYHPVSPYVWVGANYTFRKPIEIEFEHHADISNSDISEFCILKACCTKCNSDHHKMHQVTEDCIIKDSTCSLYTNHFCSYCLAAKSIQIPDRIVAYHYLPEDYESVDKFRAELCFCYDLDYCKKMTEKRFTDRKMIKNLGVSFCATKKDELRLSDPNRVDGWSVKHLLTNEISVSEINFQGRYDCSEHLANDESRDLYPPRFITQLNCHQTSRPALDVEYMLHIIKGGKVVKNYNFNIVVEQKSEKSPTTTNTTTGAACAIATTLTGKIQITEPEQLQQQSEKSPKKFATNKSITLRTLEQKPQMGDIVTFVIQNVKASWKDIAYVLKYDIPVVKAIGQNHQNDVKECCQELFENWLTTDHGVKPKTWSTLLTHLKKLEELSAAIEAIEEQLKQQLF